MPWAAHLALVPRTQLIAIVVRFWDKHKRRRREMITRAWPKTLRRIDNAEKTGKKEAGLMKSPMSACIINLPKVNIHPRNPAEWGNTLFREASIEVDEDLIARRDLLGNVADRDSPRSCGAM